ncbi:hypothetical protein G9A89_009847 [Geosiphon pyriformis]|nr:hypothetical protein G9A89_009847 [Geosiphon pyriformis]
MKSFTSILLAVVLVAGINSQTVYAQANTNSTSTTSSASNASTSTPTVPKTCEEVFQSDKCTTCQDTFFKTQLQKDNLIGCTTLVGVDISSPKFEADLTAACGLKCDTTVAKTVVSSLEKDCSDDLKKYLQVVSGAEKPSAENQFALNLGKFWTAIYSATPATQALCLKNSNGIFCAAEIQKKKFEFVTSKVKGNFALVPFGLTPPNALVSYQVENTNKTENVILPKDILCSDCYVKISQPWIDYAAKNPSSLESLRTAVDAIIKPVTSNFTSECNLKTDVVKSSNSTTSDAITMSKASFGLAAGSLIVSFLFSL